MIKPWVKTGSQKLADYRIFSVRADRKVSPHTGEAHEFYVIESVNWVNVVATTPTGELVMVEQYRHGSDTIELEVPGGVMDARDGAPEVTAARELREETGYAGGPPRIIGQMYPNPAIMSNMCFVVLVPDCTPQHPVQFDHSEDLITRLVPVAEVPGLIAAGKIRHSLVIGALCFYELWRSQEAGPSGV